MELPVIEHSAVLLGLAEVKIPFKKLPLEEGLSMVHICYRKLLEIENSESTKLKCIGVVDSFYALQEVDLLISPTTCRLLRKTIVVLQYDLNDVIAAVLALDCRSRIIIVSQTQSFGRTALVLQMQSQEVAESVVRTLTQGASNPERPPSSSKVRRGANTLGKKVHSLFSSFGSRDKSSLDYTQRTNTESSSCYTLVTSEEEDDLNTDSESDDGIDTGQEYPTVRDSSTDRRLCFNRNSMSPQEAEIKHLIDSEISFVETLKELLDFKTLSYDSPGIIKRKYSDQMLMYVEELHSFHKRWLDLLKSNENSVESVCSIFQENSDNFRFHVYYISNIPKSDRIYNTYRETLKRANPSLGDLLRKPRMRLNYYVLTFESLQKYSLNETSSISQIVDQLKAYLKEADTRLITDSVTLCPFNLMDHGIVVMTGDLSLKKGELSKRRYQVLLLEDLLVLTRGTPNSSEYVASFNLLHIELLHEMRGVFIHLGVHHKKNNTLLIFKVKSIRLQQKWIKNLKSQIESTKRNVDEGEKEENIQEKSLSYSCNRANNSRIMNEPSFLSCSMPSLTIDMVFPDLLNLKSRTTDRYSHLANIQDSERLLLTTTDSALNENKDHRTCGLLPVDIKQLHQFHLQHLYPALNYNQEDFDNYVSTCLFNERKEFIAINRNILYKAAVLKHSSNGHCECPILSIAVTNLIHYMSYFVGSECVGETTKPNFNVWEEILSNVNLDLKQKFLPEFPSNESIIMEGNLVVSEFPALSNQRRYVILTEKRTYILSVTQKKVEIETCFDNEKAKMGPPPNIKSFNIKFYASNMQKRKLNFTAESIQAKYQWILGFHRAIPHEFKRQALIRRSGRLKTKTFPGKGNTAEVTHGASADNFSLAVKENSAIMESEL